MKDIRWLQRYSNFKRAFLKLEEAIDFINDIPPAGIISGEDGKVLKEVVKEGLIQRFEYTHELAWNVMKDYAEYQGNTTIRGSRDASREAFRMQLIDQADVWMDMIQSRNTTSHTYDDDTANEIYNKILGEYFPVLKRFKETMDNILTEDMQSDE
jgi:nucleotidyltransferase substrate binding protein (TIGR01987 family)